MKKIIYCGYTFVVSVSGGYFMIEPLIPTSIKNSIFTIFLIYSAVSIPAFYITSAVDKFCEVDYLRILKTSKNMHKTINDMERISKYKFIEDLSKQAVLLKEKVNYNRSAKSLDNTHQEFTQRILEIRIKSEDISERKIYNKELPALNNMYPLQTELDFFREGELQKHCIYGYYQKALQPYIETGSEYMYFSYRKENQILATIEIEVDVPNNVYKITQMQGKWNKRLPAELSEEVKNNLEIYCNEVLGIQYKNV